MKPFTLLRDALIMPFEGTMEGFRGGVFVNDEVVRDSLLFRWQLEQPFQQAATPLPAEDVLPGAWLYGGCLFAHYGHFLWESLSRLYVWRQCKNVPLLFVSPNDELTLWQQEMFRLVGMDREIRIVKAPTRVEQLIMSPAGSVLRELLLPEQLEALGQVHASALQPERKVWLSRSQLAYGRILNEAPLERQLERRGWEIIQPQYLSVPEQARLVATSGVVAGFDGSAFHSALLADRILGRLVIFSRRGGIDKAFTEIAEKKGIDQHCHVLRVRHISEKWARSNFVHLEPRRILEILDEEAACL